MHPDGRIEEVLTEKAAKKLMPGTVQELKGAIVPGFINTHCHLELSHLRGKIPMRTGLMGFVLEVIKKRASFSEDDIQSAMKAADKELFDNGIVAIGDISNSAISKSVKAVSRMYYQTFVEIIGFDPQRAESAFEAGIVVKEAFQPLSAALAPHAPYTVSSKLFELIATADEAISTIHNQETTAENRFFENGTGGVLDLYEGLGMDISHFKPTGKSSLQSYLPMMSGSKTLLVHNTFTTKEDMAFAQQQPRELYWCLCPNANIYIENCLPDVAMLHKMGAKITLGTDSLASNHQLNILDEMKTLQTHKKIDFGNMLKWATWNGAAFLGLTKDLGSIETGKKPGLNLMQLDSDFQILTSKLSRLV